MDQCNSHFRIAGAAAAMALLLSPASLGAAPTALDLTAPSIVGRTIEDVEVGAVKPIEIRKPKPEVAAPRGNPLWSIPLSMLTATLDRPIFSASRRPPPRAVVGPIPEPVAALPPRASEPDRPMLSLIGAVVGDRDAIAVFLDRSTQGIVRLRAGDTHAGWSLSSVQPREVTLKRADQTEVLVLQRPDNAASVAGAPILPAGAPMMPAAVVTGGGATYAPFIPRSTPKNGESDGL